MVFISCSKPVTDDQFVMTLESRFARIQDPERLRQEVEWAWNELKTRPIPAVQDSHAIFLYRGHGKEVRITGDFTNWQPGPHLVQLGNSDIFALAITFPDSARLLYKFIVDGQSMIDSANVLKGTSELGECSELRMPRYVGRP
jgi:hypothetical protein